MLHRPHTQRQKSVDETYLSLSLDMKIQDPIMSRQSPTDGSVAIDVSSPETVVPAICRCITTFSASSRRPWITHSEHLPSNATKPCHPICTALRHNRNAPNRATQTRLRLHLGSWSGVQIADQRQTGMSNPRDERGRAERCTPPPPSALTASSGDDEEKVSGSGL